MISFRLEILLNKKLSELNIFILKLLKTNDGKKKGIDIFHYDSDKSYSGRKRCFKIINDYINTNSITIMDDIQDNGFFYDYILKNKGLFWKIFKFQGKYVGLIGKIN